ncbi:MAG TPA: hypothetical protein VNG93_00065 [Candidatus Dormibacteraeota bacterium]|nr:hypothetical protein [Candidatus Dormibacteraeota bacterium]
MDPRLIDFLRRWLPIAAAITLLSGTTCVVAQQVLRADANDPQVQMAEDAAAQGLTVAAAGIPAIDIKRSLAPWILVYGSDRRTVGGSARLDGKLPDYPISAFDNAPVGGRDEVTWEPQPGVRAATVIVGFKGGWVVAGRSLRLVEEREGLVLQLSILGWLLALAASAGAVLGFDLLLPQLEKRRSRQ